MKTLIIEYPDEPTTEDITIIADGPKPTEAIMALMAAGQLLGNAIAKTITEELGFKVIGKRGEFCSPQEIEEEQESNELDALLAIPAQGGSH